jgi:hypothetical protein
MFHDKFKTLLPGIELDASPEIAAISRLIHARNGSDRTPPALLTASLSRDGNPNLRSREWPAVSPANRCGYSSIVDS